MSEKIFTVKVTMEERWIPHFRGMLEKMQNLGAIGSSRVVGFFSDGDGDFRPTFEFSEDVPQAKGHLEASEVDIEYFSDAG